MTMCVEQFADFVKSRWIIAYAESRLDCHSSVPISVYAESRLDCQSHLPGVLQALAGNNITLTDTAALESLAYELAAGSTVLVIVDADAVRVRVYEPQAISALAVTDLASLVKALTESADNDLATTVTVSRSLTAMRNTSSANALLDSSSFVKVTPTIASGKLLAADLFQDQVRSMNKDGTNVSVVLGSGRGLDPDFAELRAVRAYKATTPHRYYYLANYSQLRRVNADLTGNTLIASHATGINAFDIDVAGGVIYYLTGGTYQVRRCNLDGTGDTQLLAGGILWSPGGIVKFGSLLYIADRLNKRIYRMNTDGTGGTAWITGRTGNPFGICAFNEPTIGNCIYWAEIDGGNVVGATTSGSIFHTVTGLTQALAVCADPANRHVYVCNAGPNPGGRSIRRIDTGNFGTVAGPGTLIYTSASPAVDPHDVQITP